MAKKFTLNAGGLFEYAESGKSGILGFIEKAAAPPKPKKPPKRKGGTKTTKNAKQARQRERQRQQAVKREQQKQRKAQRRQEKEQKQKKVYQEQQQKAAARKARKQQQAAPKTAPKPKKQSKPKLSAEEYKKQRIKNIENADSPRMKAIIDLLNLLCDRLADIFANLPPELRTRIPAPPEAGKHYEIGDFYGNSYDDEIIGGALDEVDKIKGVINKAMDDLLQIKARRSLDMELAFEIEAIINELDALLGEIEKTGVTKQRAISNENLRKYKNQSQKAKDILKKL